jgi:hypothetical protein
MDLQPTYQVENEDSYRVEVSGWDAKENFFVEKTMLHWSGDEHKEISLRSNVREGSVVFIRLLQPFSKAAGFPVPYKAASVTAEATARTLVRLARLRPRPPFKEEVSASEKAKSKVA